MRSFSNLFFYRSPAINALDEIQQLPTSTPEAKQHVAMLPTSNGESEAAVIRLSLLVSSQIRIFFFKRPLFWFSVNLLLQRTGEARLTRIALAIVWLFIFCHAWRLIPTVYEAVYPAQRAWPTWLHHVNGMSHSFILLNSAVNFLLYTVL